MLRGRKKRSVGKENNPVVGNEQERTRSSRQSEKRYGTDNLNPTNNPDIRYEREIVDIPDNKYVEMYNHFGSTKNYDVAGYIIGYGVMLDFSGKHWGDTRSTFRQVDHRDVQEVLDDRGNNGFNAMIDMIGNGNIRLMPEVGGINLAIKPNATQMNVLRDYINNFRGEIVVDIDKVGGDTIHSFEYTKGTSSSKIISDIKAYFDEGIVPEQKAKDETDIRQFLYERAEITEDEVISQSKKAMAAELTRLRELLKMQGRESHGTVFTKSSVDLVAAELIREADSRLTKAYLVIKLAVNHIFKKCSPNFY